MIKVIKLTFMARITSWQSNAAGGVTSATSRASKSPWVSPFRSSSNAYDVNTARQFSNRSYTQPHPCKYTKAKHRLLSRKEETQELGSVSVALKLHEMIFECKKINIKRMRHNG